MPELRELVQAAGGKRRLNLGCGDDVREGWVNADIADLPGVDHVIDVNESLPFADGAFDTILCKDLLEHVLDVPATMAELHRVLDEDGCLVFEVPHFTSRNQHIDPTHRRGFSIDTARMFVPNGKGERRSYYFTFAFTRCWGSTLLFYRRPWLPWNYLAQRLFNVHPQAQRLYEHTFLARLFPAFNVAGVLQR
jgi:SAM-dependent methyltransferase